MVPPGGEAARSGARASIEGGEARDLELVAAEEDEGAGVLVGDALVGEGGGEVGGFGAGVEDDAGGGEVEDFFGEFGGAGGVEVESEGVDGLGDLGEGGGDGGAVDFGEGGVDGDDGVAVFFEEEDGLVGVAVGFVAGAEDGDGLIGVGHEFSSSRFPNPITASTFKPIAL
jgi:hypothetical protein